MSQPTLTLTRKIPLTLYRKSNGHRVNGKWVEGAEVQVVIQANVQPLKTYEIQMMVEADRTKSWLKLYSAQEIKTLREGTDQQADEFVWLGQRYKVMRVDPWSMGVLDHYKAYAVRIEVTPN